MRRVFSSHIDQIGYDAVSQELIVKFQNGKTAVYMGVPFEVAQDVLSAPSIGTALNQLVKGRYSYGYKNT